MGDPLYPVMEATAARFQRTTREYEIRCLAPETSSPDQQAKLIERLADSGLRAVCVQVSDPRASADLLKALRAKGLVVASLMQRVDATEQFLHSGIDQHQLGVALANALVRLLDPPATVATLGDIDDLVARQRLEGFREEINRHPRITVLRELNRLETHPATARSIRRLMERFQGIDGWAAVTDWPESNAPGAEPVLPDGCKLVRPGPIPDMIQHLTSGRCDAVIVSDFGPIVMRGLEMCASTLEGRTLLVPDRCAPLRSVTTDTLADYLVDWNRWTNPDAEY